MTTQQPQPQPSHNLEALLLKRVAEVELPPSIAAGLIVQAARENWTPAHLRSERARAKWRYFFDELLREVEAEEAPEEEGLPMLREGQDEDC